MCGAPFLWFDLYARLKPLSCCMQCWCHMSCVAHHQQLIIAACINLGNEPVPDLLHLAYDSHSCNSVGPSACWDNGHAARCRSHAAATNIATAAWATTVAIDPIRQAITVLLRLRSMLHNHTVGFAFFPAVSGCPARNLLNMSNASLGFVWGTMWPAAATAAAVTTVDAAASQ